MTEKKSKSQISIQSKAMILRKSKRRKKKRSKVIKDTFPSMLFTFDTHMFIDQTREMKWFSTNQI